MSNEAVIATPDTKTTLGFWIYLMTDCILFASLFATYAVLQGGTFGGVTGKDIFDMPFVLAETILLLVSSFTCGVAVLMARAGKANHVIGWFAATFVLGAVFLGMELWEFSHLVHEGNSWQASAFLSAFFTLVGTHGLHIFIGLLWIGTMIYRIWEKGITTHSLRKLTLLGLFWHFLAVVCICIFTFVFLMGVA